MGSKIQVDRDVSGVLFTLTCDGRFIKVIATAEYLKGKYQALNRPDGWLNAYLRNEPSIDAEVRSIARRKKSSLVILTAESKGT